MEPTPLESNLKIPRRCLRAWRAISGALGYPPAVGRRGGWWSYDDVACLTGHADDARKLRLLYELRPDLLRRTYLDRANGNGLTDVCSACSDPVTLFRIAEHLDPTASKRPDGTLF